MKGQVRYTRMAQAEVELASAWYDLQRAELGTEFLGAFDKSIEAIAEGPQRWPRYFRAVRRYVMSQYPYIIYFDGTADKIRVLRVVHASRDPVPIRELFPKTEDN